jgi:hypothetical protein
MSTRKNTADIKRVPGCLQIRRKVSGCMLLLLFFISFFFAPSLVWAFTIPEKLVYDLTWTGVSAGTATLEVSNSNGVTKLVSTAHSADWVSAFYKVDNRVESLLKNGKPEALIGLPENYRIKLREGRHKRDRELNFDHSNLKVTFIDHRGKEKKTYRIGENTFDPLSSFYSVRTLPLVVGKSVYVNIFDSKKFWRVEVQVLRKEKVRTSLGRFNTVVIKPLMQSEGLFNRKGDMYIWLTDDVKRIPVKMQTKVAIGSITATLVEGTF